MFPALPVSRLLFSLNDSDVPLHKPFNYLYALTQMTAYLPRDVQAVVLNVTLLVLLNVTAIVCFQLRAFSSIGLYVLLAGIAGLTVLFGCLEYRKINPLPSSAPTDDDIEEGHSKGSTRPVHRPLLELSEAPLRVAGKFAGEYLRRGRKGDADKSMDDHPLRSGDDGGSGADEMALRQKGRVKSIESLYASKTTVAQGWNPLNEIEKAAAVARSSSPVPSTDGRSKGVASSKSGKLLQQQSYQDLLFDFKSNRRKQSEQHGP